MYRTKPASRQEHTLIVFLRFCATLRKHCSPTDAVSWRHVMTDTCVAKMDGWMSPRMDGCDTHSKS
ncbi:unnamed protein product [Clavelina lepadiformis]|uniref:Secreted protein n=1 Tax=Clavelina lepadiformis TaxID=159417 RepID=A0ABP0FYS7_CLALP